MTGLAAVVRPRREGDVVCTCVYEHTGGTVTVRLIHSRCPWHWHLTNGTWRVVP